VKAEERERQAPLHVSLRALSFPLYLLTLLSPDERRTLQRRDTCPYTAHLSRRREMFSSLSILPLPVSAWRNMITQ